MVGTIIEKELRLTLLTFRFAACSLLLLLILAASTSILVLDWRQQVDRFEASAEQAAKQAREATAYAGVSLRLERRPRLAALINQGIGDRFGRAVTLSGKYDVPRLSGGVTGGGSAREFLGVDFAQIVGILVSLVALVFTYDLVNGDRARGTLAMTLAFNVPRARLLFGKYLGSLLSLLAPFVGAFLLWLILLQGLTGAEIDGATWARIGAAFLLSVLYGSAFLWLGLLTSTLTARASTALIFSLLVWTSAVVIYPPTATQVVNLARPLSELVEETAPPEDLARDEALRARVEAARWEVVRRATDQYQAARALMRLSPMAAYDFATAALAGTDVHSHIALLSAARQTDEILRAWQREKARKHPDRELTHSNFAVPLDLSGLPEPREPREELARVIERILPEILLLILANLLLMIAAQAAFQRYDVRL